MSLSAILDTPAAPETTSPEPHRPKIGFVSLGCPKNLVDSEVMMGLLHRAGGQLTPRAEDAEILVVNTCSFIDSAKQESVDTILEMVQHESIANGGRGKPRSSSSPAASSSATATRSAKTSPKSTPSSAPASSKPSSKRPASTAPHPPRTASPFAILTTAQVDRHASSVNQHSRPESDSAQLRHEASAVSSRPDQRERRDPCIWSRREFGPLFSDPLPSTLDPFFKTRRRRPRSKPAASPAKPGTAPPPPLPTYLYSDETPRILTTPRASAYIKIAEGCDHPCSFCIIPQLRGKFRSRPLASIVAEAKSLIAQGVREITLIGQDTTCYGEDLAPSITINPASAPRLASETWDSASIRRKTPPPELADLLDALAPLPGLKWLRFLYAYPNKITTRLLESIARHDTIAKYLDVPLAARLCANVLKRMRRGGTSARFLQIIDKARKTVPNLVLRTSFIVGFPGETDADFEELCAFIQAAQIDWLGVFSYSDEEGAQGLRRSTRKVPKRTIEARRRKLMRLQQKISPATRSQWIGRELDILVEGEYEETDLLWQGRSLDQAPEIDGKVLINDFGPHETLVPGTFYRAEITESHDYDVVARIMD